MSFRIRARRFLAITERVKAKRRLAKLEADLRLAQKRSEDGGPDNDNDCAVEGREIASPIQSGDATRA